ncbi:NAD(P)H-dependent oxidoreductase [Kitasatospora sp. NPDC056731]|uniref:NAD(P)H-dependent oxidoreductase n=1 Tax=Kitasatospora sp. NPDC056731 TaxID=3155422 RepID=UPI00343AA210
MKVLIVHAHPDPASFNAALKDTAVATLRAQGHEVQVSDLYAMGFKAVPDAEDFTDTRRDPERLQIDVEQEHQYETGTHPPDVAAEQAKVEWCDLLILQFPIWWFSMPAVLKGWVERVMSRGFAYRRGRKHAKGVFLGRRAMICCTTGTSAATYAPDGIEGDIQHLLWPVNNGVFHYLGFTPLPPFVAFAPRQATDEDRRELLDAYAHRLRRIEDVEPLYFHPREDYGPDQRLLPGVEARSGFQRSPRAPHRPAAPAEEHSDERGPEKKIEKKIRADVDSAASAATS